MKRYSVANRYGARCGACGANVPTGKGILESVPGGRRRRWIVWCSSCYDKSDNSGAEDRACGDRAYEDECARRVNY